VGSRRPRLGFFSDASSGNTVPFYMLPSLGGKDTLRGYEDYRFHDSNLLWPVRNHDGRCSATSMSPRLRCRNVAAVPAISTAQDVVGRRHSRATRGHRRWRAWTSSQPPGIRVFVSLSDPFHPQRLSRLTAAAPFEP